MARGAAGRRVEDWPVEDWRALGEVRTEGSWVGQKRAGQDGGGAGSSVCDFAGDDRRDSGAAFQFGQPLLGGLLPLFLGT